MWKQIDDCSRAHKSVRTYTELMVKNANNELMHEVWSVKRVLLVLFFSPVVMMLMIRLHTHTHTNYYALAWYIYFFYVAW